MKMYNGVVCNPNFVIILGYLTSSSVTIYFMFKSFNDDCKNILMYFPLNISRGIISSAITIRFNASIMVNRTYG